MHKNAYLLASAILILLSAVISLAQINNSSLSDDEAAIVWLVDQSSNDDEASIRGRVRGVVSGIGLAFDHISEINGNPLLYIISLNVWSQLFGQSIVGLRLLAMICSLIALAVVIALGTSIYDRVTGLLAGVIIAIAPFLIFFAIEIQPVMMFVALGIITTWAYRNWLHTPILLNTLLYLLSGTLLIFTHIYGVLVLIGHVVWLIYTRRFKSLYYVPYILFALFGGLWLWFVRPSFLNSIPVDGVITILIALPLAYLIRRALIPAQINWEGDIRGILLVVIAFVSVQLALRTVLYPPKYDWQAMVTNITEIRQPFEPVIFHVPPRSAIAYYSSELGLRGGYTLDVGWRDWDNSELADVTSAVQGQSSIWLVTRTSLENSDALVTMLSQGAEATFQEQLSEMVIYRFERQ